MPNSTGSSAEQQRATAIGSSFILLGSLAALWTSYIQHTPPFLAAGLVLAIGFSCFLTRWIITGAPWQGYFRQPLKVWLLGLYGIPTYFALYTASMQTASVIEANLLNYIWPVTLVVTAVLLDRKSLKWFQFCGLVACMIGMVILALSRLPQGLPLHWQTGHSLALVGGLIWGSYSALARRFSMIDSNVTGVFFGMAALVLLLLSVMTEKWPPIAQWDFLPILTGGIIVQWNFYAWDIGMKKGNAQLLGVAAYLMPFLSLTWLVLFGRGTVTSAIFLAAFFVIGGAVLAGFDRVQAVWAKRKRI